MIESAIGERALEDLSDREIMACFVELEVFSHPRIPDSVTTDFVD